MVHNNLAPPGKQLMKHLGHDVGKLYVNLQQRSRHQLFEGNVSFTCSTPFGERILKFVSDFGMGMRYANLDALAEGTPLATPFSEWKPILDAIVQAKVKQRVRDDLYARCAAIERTKGENMLVITTGMDGLPLDFSSAFALPKIYDLAAPHVIWEILLLLAPIRDFVVQAGRLASQIKPKPKDKQNIPYLREFFDFLYLDRTLDLRKKHWP